MSTLASPIDEVAEVLTIYKANVGIISGTASDHINVFPTFQNYIDQFKTLYTDTIQPGGRLIYSER